MSDAKLREFLEEALRDAARYRWLRAQNPGAVCAIAWRVKAACAFSTPDEATDAAMRWCPDEVPHER